MTSLVAIVGPTAVGKSRLALDLAERFDAEIIGADSRQVYRYMDIGTAKPSREDRSLVPHHLIDVVDPDEEFSLALYLRAARKAIETIGSRGRTALLVGGSGLYVWALLEGWQVPEVPPDPAYRRELESRARVEGGDTLYAELMALDPAAAERIDQRNTRRVIRALEVYRQDGCRSRLRRKRPFLDYRVVGLTTSRSELHGRVDERVDAMMARGLVSEVEWLIARGYVLDLPSMSGLGYRQIGMYLKGELGIEDAVRRIKTETHRYVRQQYSWFSMKDTRIHWFEEEPGVHNRVSSLLVESSTSAA